MKQTSKFHRLYIVGMDANGNKVVRIRHRMGSGKRGFSIQTNDNLPSWHKCEVGEVYTARSACSIFPSMTKQMAFELTSYIGQHGTEYQRSFFVLTK